MSHYIQNFKFQIKIRLRKKLIEFIIIFYKLAENHMQSNSMQEESSSDLQASLKMDKNNSEKDQSINFIELAKMHLKAYEDINEDEFEMVEEIENVDHSNKICNQFYLQLHSTYVPIGTNFQAYIPDIMNSSTYLYRNQSAITRLKALKVHDPAVNSNFYSKWHQFIQQKFGPLRTYEQIACIKKCIDQYFPGCTFQQYFSNPKIFKFWDEQFKNKDIEALKKLKKKKKKYKGSMDP